jgi:hypothetical protein
MGCQFKVYSIFKTVDKILIPILRGKELDSVAVQKFHSKVQTVSIQPAFA